MCDVTFRCLLYCRQELYRAAKKRFDEEPEFKTRSRENVKRLQSGDPACLAAWSRICDASRREFEKIYTRLGVTLTERGESFYNPMLKVWCCCTSIRTDEALYMPCGSALPSGSYWWHSVAFITARLLTQNRCFYAESASLELHKSLCNNFLAD